MAPTDLRVQVASSSGSARDRRVGYLYPSITVTNGECDWRTRSSWRIEMPGFASIRLESTSARVLGPWERSSSIATSAVLRAGASRGIEI
jgi:hypothetical protein